MCGIVGALHFKSSPTEVDAATLSRMRDTMVHRGPDGAGIWLSQDRRVGLGHRRLSIIDLSDQARQPMCALDGSLQITYNGEIYNHADLRRELIELGHYEWTTDHSDTEVILRAYLQWGHECLHRFKGMFAFGLWDDRRRELWLVRDRLGVKPLYYALRGDQLLFASEIKALLEHPDQKARLDEDALFHFLSFLASPGPETLFKGIRKLACGHWLIVREDGTVREQRYWDAAEAALQLPAMAQDEAAALVLEELRRAVQRRKVADVPVGVFLSGGLDSSCNAALFAEEDPGGVRTYNVAYAGDPESYKNEHTYAREVARFVGAQHKEVFLEADDATRFLPRMIEYQDEPIADPVCVPLYYVAKLARDDGMVVCQVGEGADELFCGYDHWRHMLRLAQWNDLPIPRFVKSLGLAALDASGKRFHPYRERLRRAASGVEPFWGGAESFTQAEKEHLLSNAFRSRYRGRTSWEAIEPHWKRFCGSTIEQSHMNWMTYIDLNLRLPELLLMRVDKMTMAVSLEARVPYLDHALVELALGLPQAIKYQGGELKPLLKSAVKGLVPDAIITRKKQGFGAPLKEWFLEPLGEQAKATIRRFAARTPYFDSTRVESWLCRAEPRQIWYLQNLALWHERFIEGKEQRNLG